MWTLVTSVVELIHALPRRGDRPTDAPRRQPDAAGRRPAPAPRRHQRRGRPRRRPAPGDRALGRGARPARRPRRSRCLAVAARPQRVSGGLDETARLDARRDAGRRLARHPRPRGPPRRRRRSACASRSPASQVERSPRHDRRSSTARPASRAQVELRVGTERPPAPAHPAAQHRRLPATPSSRLQARLPRAVGRHRDPRHHRPAPARAHAAAARLHASARTCARAAAAGPARTRRCCWPPGAPGFGFERGRVHGVHVAWSGNHRARRRARRHGRGVPRRRRAAAPGEIVLAPGESYTTPVGHRVVGRRPQRALRTASTTSGARARSTRAGRGRSPSTPGRPSTSTTPSTGSPRSRMPRPRVGVERFVLDDGWFHGRRDDTAGLGDWFVDDDVWPDGLHPLDRPRARPRHGVRPLGRARDGQPRQRPRPRAPRLDPARRGRRCRRRRASSRCSTSRTPRRTPTSPGACTRCWTSTRSPTSSGTTTATCVDAGSGPAGVARVHEHTLRRSTALLDELKAAPPRARDRELRLGRRARRPRHPRPHRPHLDQRQPRPARAPGQPAVHRRCSCRPS